MISKNKTNCIDGKKTGKVERFFKVVKSFLINPLSQEQLAVIENQRYGALQSRGYNNQPGAFPRD